MSSVPAYPHPHAPPSGKARVRAALLRGMAFLYRGQGGHPPASLVHARILVLRPDHLGDLLFLGPALRWLRNRLPHAHITLAIGPWARPALPGLAGTYDALLELPFPGFERGPRAGGVQRWRLLGTMARILREHAFHVAVIARPDHWWGAMLARLAGIPWRVGFQDPQARGWLTHAFPLAREHAVVSNMRLMAALTGDTLHPDPQAHPLQFALSPAATAEARQLLSQLFPDLGPRPLAVIHPGSGAAIKLWEPAKWGAVARHLVQQGARVVVTGGPQERALTQQVATAGGPGVVDLGGRTRFATLAALLAQATWVLGPDSGPLHLAVAVGTATIHLYGPSDPILFGPWGDPTRHIPILSHWACAPCGTFDWPDLPAHGCVREIPLARVLEALDTLRAV